MSQSYDYMILGGGMAGANAVMEIRKRDPDGTVLIVTRELDKPYHRPPLTKEFWTFDNYPEESIYYGFLDDEGIDYLTEAEVTAIHPEKKMVIIDDDAQYTYNKLLYTLGSDPKWIEGPKSDRVLAIRTFEDYRQLKGFAKKDSKALIVGGGWIGAELAASLQINGVDVTLLYPDEVLNEKRLPLALAEKFQQSFKEAGVTLVGDAYADHYQVKDQTVVLTLEDGREFTGDFLVLGIGVEPNIVLAEQAGLEVGNGVIANEYLQSSDPSIYVAGDVLNYEDVIIGRNRFEHEDQAVKSGQVAGRNMTGVKERFEFGAPLSYTDVLDISIEGVGEMSRNRDDEIIEQIGEGYIVYYLSDGEPSGILTYNVKVDMNKARAILQNPPKTAQGLIGSLQPL
ncbi:NAD(P)/FAD-dependent oxidoreductase [Aerococcaceae bacterium DSM 111020]|nr:NAD(P)/FAD-dependent oxidoreductase [Aerococcaceae bacterium DSM 111020]